MSHPPENETNRSLFAAVETAAPATPLQKWLFEGDHDGESHAHHPTHPWWQVLWLTGVDYFSTLGYQPGIALLAAGALSPIATLVLVLVTLFGALPVYAQVAGRSYTGQGSIAMLANLLSGWRSKMLTLILLGFAATDFVITMTLSAADAAEHLVENPLVAQHLHHGQLWVTLVLLVLLTAVFLKGFREAIGLAVGVGIPYLLLNAVVAGRCFIEIAEHPNLLSNWQAALTAKGDFTHLALAAALIFPRLALGLSGFETGVSVMPLVEGDASDIGAPRPMGRIRASRKLLFAAAAIMSVLLVATSFVTSVLVPKEAYEDGGPAAGRVLAYLCHELMGHGFGTVYDISTILILWFAGASAMAGLLNVVPRYLPRLGMAPRWVAAPRPLVLVLFAVDVVVTLIFHADVEKQAGAYATGVLVLILSASVAVALALGRERTGTAGASSGEDEHCEDEDAGNPVGGSPSGEAPAPLWKVCYYWGVAAVFAYTLIQNVHERPDGLVIASIFILAIMALSALSRWVRATELRVEAVTLAHGVTPELWRELLNKRVNLAPLKVGSGQARLAKGDEIRKHYQIDGPIAFLHVHLRDDRSDFKSPLQIHVRRLGGDYMVEVTGAVALANTIAYMSELIDPRRLFLGLTRQNSVSQAIRYVFWGEGETGILVYEILLKHWERTPEDDVRPLIFLMSE